MTSRRRFLGSIGLPAFAAAAGVPLFPPRLDASSRLREVLATRHASPRDAAYDEEFWGEIARSFTVDRSLVNLNNGGVSPSPAYVQDAMKRHLDYSNEAPVYTMWRILEPQREAVRERLAREWDVDAEEIALTRNASEGLQILQFGFDLEPGDEVLTTEIVRRFEAEITPRTRLILMCHVINLTGQILPVREVVALGRRHGIPVIVDGAHALAHFDFRLSDLDCDYYATSLHKWLAAPHGTGLLYVRREKIPDLWPLQAAGPNLDADIRKFEEIGTHPAAGYLAIAEALTFHQAIGALRKEERLRYLRDSWAEPLVQIPGVVLHTSLDPEFSCGFANVEIEGIEPGALTSWLWREHRIIVTPIVHPEFQGIRVSSSVYTTHEELARFVDAMERAARQGIPT
jgi:selenocysteine lyase/cysteine desulfurase